MPTPFVSMKWGDASHLTKALFGQDKVWVTAQSDVRQIAEMSPQHCLNTLLMIERMDDLPIDDLHATPLYAALYDRVLSFLPPRERFEHRIGTQTGRISCAKPDINPDGELWPHTTIEHPADTWRKVREAVSSSSASPSTLARRIGVEREAIQSILEAAIAANTPTGNTRVLIDYTDADGNDTSLREIIPREIENRRVRFGFNEKYVKAFDVDKGAPRVFKLERITRCEDA